MRHTIVDAGRLRTIPYIERWIETMHATDEPLMGHSVRGSLSQRSVVLASMVMLDAARNSCMLCGMPAFAARAFTTSLLDSI